MAEKNDPEKRNLFYQNDKGEWLPLMAVNDLETAVELKIEMTEEDEAKLAAALVPLGNLEIVPREE